MLNYIVEGQGAKAMLFIHGFGGASGIWRWTLDELAPGMRCVAVDLPGHGHSEGQAASTEAMATGVQEVILRESITRVHVVASSIGGLVALRLGERLPEAVSAISLVGALPRFISDNGFPAGLNISKVRKLAGQLEGDIRGILDMFFRSLFTLHERESVQYGKIKELLGGLTLPRKEALLSMLDVLEQEDLRSVLSGMAVPLQMINGDRDPLCPLSAVEKCGALNPRVRVDIIKDCGHFPFLSYPSVFSACVKEFAGL